MNKEALIKDLNEIYNLVSDHDITEAMERLEFVIIEINLLQIPVANICLERAKKYARHQHFLGTQGNELVEFEDWKAKTDINS